MMSTKKKTIIITAIVIAAFAIMGVVYAILSGQTQEIRNRVTVGSVVIDDVNFTIKDSNGDVAELLSPADIDTISWTTKNEGTSAVLTRHTLEIYWGNNVELFMYPANMTREAILADYEIIKAGGTSEHALPTEPITKTVQGVTKTGIKYNFIGDTLNGSESDDVSSETNYNLPNNAENADIIDTSINTDDTNKTQDEIKFKILVSPRTSYLAQGERIDAQVTTEGMQYTEDGSGNWQVVDVVTLP